MIAPAMSTLYSFTPVGRVHEVVQGHRDRHRIDAGEHDTEQEVIPDLRELPDQAAP